MVLLVGQSYGLIAESYDQFAMVKNCMELSKNKIENWIASLFYLGNV